MMEKGIQLNDAKRSVGKGWGGILERLYKCIPKTTVVTCVKEKFGSLRFYIAGGSDKTHDLIMEAEIESETTCELCGAPGYIYTEGWHVCRCPRCRENER
jgi:hypothetical protein